eukprot:TRINITY_DN19365_c0_g1_i1.p1 TRINITY_DN19365_c0_g1~~TRINITY_DN19365_c0_g1_i1.p1  ORF type:complete len:255 (-),score=37.63 TRINITY_DN19365_c0_g1_i1:324-1088(-)
MLVVNKMQRADPAVRIQSEAFRGALGIEPNVNMYIAPPNTPGLSPHHDPQDVMIVQIEGRKHWQVCQPLGAGKTLPTRVSDSPEHPLYYRYTAQQLDETECWAAWLESGDVLYMPRGTIHAGNTTGAARSVHLTFGFDGDFTVADFLKGAQMSKALPRAELLTQPTCLAQREMNRMVPHTAFSLVSSELDDDSRVAVGQFVKVLRGLEWGEECWAVAEELLGCEGCMHQTLWLMRRVQQGAHARRIDPWAVRRL